MNRIDFSLLGGFPVTQDTLAFLQNTYTDAIRGIASIAGDNIIISGCEQVGMQVSPGWIVVSGELLPFTGGVGATTFLIREVAESAVFYDQNQHDVYFTRYAEFGAGPGQINWATLKRYNLPELDRLKMNKLINPSSFKYVQSVISDYVAASGTSLLVDIDEYTVAYFQGFLSVKDIDSNPTGWIELFDTKDMTNAFSTQYGKGVFTPKFPSNTRIYTQAFNEGYNKFMPLRIEPSNNAEGSCRWMLYCEPLSTIFPGVKLYVNFQYKTNSNLY